MKKNDRRKFLREFGISVASASLALAGGPAALAAIKPVSQLEQGLVNDFANTPDRIWIGEKYWSIPMEDWQLKAGRIECTGNVPNSRVNLLTTILHGGNGEFKATTDLGLLATSPNRNQTGSAGFSLGIKDEIDPDIKAACYYGKGLRAGVSLQEGLFIGEKTKSLPKGFDFSTFSLSIEGAGNGTTTQLTLTCRGKDGKSTSLAYELKANLEGLVALVNNFHEKGGANFWFKNFSLTGSKLASRPENSFGPILWAMHTLSKGTLNLMAQMPPLGAGDSQEVGLQFKNGNVWEEAATENISKDAYTAHFRINNWDAGKAVPYQLVYRNNGQTYTYGGTVRQEPDGRPLRFGGLTCQEWGGYPYSPLLVNLKKHDPDMLYFSGDQLYEGNGGYPIKRAPERTSVLSYLGKWYMFGWAFGNMMRDRPTICTPDDHDVFHGNIWGEGGKTLPLENWEKSQDDHGGYVQTPQMLNVVAKTQCGHLPAPFHPQPLYTGMETWYTDLVYGQVSFAIISDRMFKSGPDLVRSGEGRLDHITEPVSEGELEDRNLTLLGVNQMQFLEHWVGDWQGASMKVLLSQTLFCNVSTHHGAEKMFLHGDMDSGGWPKKQRDGVLRLVRKACTFHINGDQHLPYIVQYGIDEPKDGGWTYCTPAISTGYIRWGQPDLINIPYTNRPEHGLPNTGIYPDGFGNVNFVYAVGNPLDNYQDKNRYRQAQNKSSGFGIITFDPKDRTIKMDAYRFLADKDNPKPDDHFPGWPLTISQTENDGRKPAAYLAKLEINRSDQVVRIIDEETDELVSILRIKGFVYSPKVYSRGPFTIEVGEGRAVKVLEKIKPINEGSKETISIQV
ncbi:alkaline phosphatase D family protein [Salegentibacter sp. BDJ18]|uniref:alkaline phosphatase D family protein n=1 Tax=Salegentibacter sp. BDJ18 TaxID=2816376 RepID=UPI001AAE1A5B|nr:alkaline phosphatase D family protein [Salegentibacter sp. BDJ18]MBO2543585.1 alkaline phosphatase D family protein [Salegentibacter sp. BDJ18]